MTNLENLRLAEKRRGECEHALVGFVTFHLPVRLRARFTGETGREVFVHSVVYGNRVWPREHERQYGDAVRRAQKFLVAIPRYRKLYDSNFDAYVELANARYQDELDQEDYALSIEETYRTIDSEMADGVLEECRELGLTS